MRQNRICLNAVNPKIPDSLSEDRLMFSSAGAQPISLKSFRGLGHFPNKIARMYKHEHCLPSAFRSWQVMRSGYRRALLAILRFPCQQAPFSKCKSAVTAALSAKKRNRHDRNHACSKKFDFTVLPAESFKSTLFLFCCLNHQRCNFLCIFYWIFNFQPLNQ